MFVLVVEDEVVFGVGKRKQGFYQVVGNRQYTWVAAFLWMRDVDCFVGYVDVVPF